MGKEIEYENSLLFWSISPVYYVVRIFGLAPYSVVVEEGKAHYRLTKFSLFYSIFVLCFFLLTLIPVTQYHKLKLDLTTIDDISKYSDLYRTTNGFILGLSALICALTSRQEMCWLLDEMIDFDEDLGNLGIKVDYRGHYRKYLIGVAFTDIPLVLFFISDLIMFVFMERNSFFYWTACIFHSTLNFLTFVNFVGYLYMAIARFQLLNKCILSMVTRPLPRSNLWTTKNSLGTASSTFKQSNKSRKSITISKFEHNPLNTLCKMHDRLCEWSKRLNAIYSIQILVVVGVTFVLLVIQLYFVYLMLSENELYAFTPHKAWTSAIWGILFFMMIFIITFFCSKTKDMANESIILLHKINLDLRDDETRVNAEMFYLQMFHQKVEFTACGFFPVDFSVLYMILGTVTTYLVFLVQFEMANRSLVKLS